MTVSRRGFITAFGAATVLFHPDRVRAAPAQDAASDEEFWAGVQNAFTVDRSIVNLNSGGVGVPAAVTQESMKRHLDYSNTAAPHSMWHVLEPQRETVRARLAGAFGVDAEEIALTRNASESLQSCQFGVDLKPGDEVLTTTQDYPRMVNTFKQRERREGIVLRQFSIPVPAEDPDEIVARFEKNITEKTKLILMCHVINLTGQILPVKRVVAMARGRGLPVIVDGAHSFAHFPFTHADLDCDYYGTSLHKWLCAPHGTGMLYVRREKIAGVWPLMAAADTQDADIRKFEEIGTHPAANTLAIAEALTFHEGIGPARKAARLRALRDRWAVRLREIKNVKLRTSLRPEFSCGIATVDVDGVDPNDLASYLWSKHRILVVAIKHDEVNGIRVTPNVFTTLEEIDRFAGVMEKVATRGLPKE